MLLFSRNEHMQKLQDAAPTAPRRLEKVVDEADDDTRIRHKCSHRGGAQRLQPPPNAESPSPGRSACVLPRLAGLRSGALGSLHARVGRHKLLRKNGAPE